MSATSLMAKRNFISRDSLVKEESSFVVIKVTRVVFLFAVLLFTLLLQTTQASFINADVIIPVYLLLSISFFINGVYLLNFNRAVNSISFNSLIFVYDAFCITGLMFLTQASQTVFLIYYLINILLCGLIYRVQGALLLALWTSILFSLLLLVGPQLEGQKLFMAIILNNLSFFGVAAISGILASRFFDLNEQVEIGRQDVKALQALNQLIVENIQSGLVTVDSSWHIVHFNESAQKILGTQVVSGSSLKELFFNNFRSIQQAIELSASMARVEINHVDENLNKKIIELVISKIRNATQEGGYIVLLQDLTEIKAKESKLKHQEKLAAVGQLAAGIAHEIRNPLASISGSIQLMASGGTKEENSKLMAISIKEIDRLNLLITEFLEYVRPEDHGNEIVDINFLISEILSFVKLNKNLRQDIEQHIDCKAQGRIEGTSAKLKQALINIVINAYQAMTKTENPKIEVRSYDNGASVVLTIKDNGIGMKAENIKKIFEPFHTTKNSGTGLGLAITYKILEGHSADISVDSIEGEGTTFTIEFPVKQSPLGSEFRLKKEA